MVDHCDKPVNLGFFFGEYQERIKKSLMKKIIFSVQNFCYSFDASLCKRSINFIRNMWENDYLGSYFIKYSRLYLTSSKAIEKKSIKERLSIP